MLKQIKDTAKTVEILDVPFFSGSTSEAINLIKKGGLLTAPSGPGLANDLPSSPEYRRSLGSSDIVFADSGLCACDTLFSKRLEKAFRS